MRRDKRWKLVWYLGETNGELYDLESDPDELYNLWNSKKYITVVGKVEGSISKKKRGKNGFGYDPIFIPNGYKITYGQMQYSKKIKIDHRYKAFKKIRKFF